MFPLLLPSLTKATFQRIIYQLWSEWSDGGTKFCIFSLELEAILKMLFFITINYSSNKFPPIPGKSASIWCVLDNEILMTYSFQIWWMIPHPGHPVHTSHPSYPVLVIQLVLQDRVYHRFGIFLTNTGDSCCNSYIYHLVGLHIRKWQSDSITKSSLHLLDARDRLWIEDSAPTEYCSTFPC